MATGPKTSLQVQVQVHFHSMQIQISHHCHCNCFINLVIFLTIHISKSLAKTVITVMIHCQFLSSEIGVSLWQCIYDVLNLSHMYGNFLLHIINKPVRS